MYNAGITYSVKASEKISPPMMAAPMGMREVDESPKARAIGKAPRMVAKLVIKIGRKRCDAASMTPSVMLNPL